MIANALGANVVAIDIKKEKLDFARSMGARAIINAGETNDVVQSVVDITDGGAHVSIDGLGSPITCFNSIANLRKHGRHIQVGLMVAEYNNPAIPMDKVIAHELEIMGSHGMQAYRYTAMLEMIQMGKLDPGKLVGKRVSLEEAAGELVKMDTFKSIGVTVIDKF
jgi:alcohol dehydrogenase